MKPYTDSLEKLLEEFARLPGVGRKSAERMAYHILSVPEEEAMALARAIRDVKRKTRNCSVCGNLTEGDPCPICTDGGRDRSVICVVEYPRDVTQIEKTGYRGLYHVLMGHLSPIDGVEPGNLRIAELGRRVAEGDVKEVVLALNPNVEGDATAAYIFELLKDKGVALTRPARGLPAGSEIEFADERVLTDAIYGREPFGEGASE